MPPPVITSPKLLRPKKKHPTRAKTSAKKQTLGQLNKRLAETRAHRLAAAEQNCLKIVGRTRL